MRVLWTLIAILLLSTPVRTAAAQSDESPLLAEEEASIGAGQGDMHIGAYLGGWVSNYFHDFYAEPTDEVRDLEGLSPAFGLRFAYFVHEYVGAEAEFQYTMAKLVTPNSATPIYGLRAHALAQLPGRIAPFAALGAGASHLSSSDAVLGSDTDFFVHAGVGAHFYLTDAIALRADARYLRGPSPSDGGSGSNYAELMLGLSFSPKFSSNGHVAPKPEPEPEPEPEPGDDPLPPEPPEDLDLDDDGFPNASDQCPEQAEDKDGFEDEDGCPDNDNDNDTIEDKNDKCPMEPEDMDGYLDGDGCDDPDNDNDGIPDVIDECAIEPETINGNKDDDGCPDAGDSLVMLMPARIEIFESVLFRGNSAVILKKSHNVLSQIGATMRANRDILSLSVGVHVHPRGANDVALTKLRARAVRKWLINWGVEAERLEAKGHGSKVLLVPQSSKGAKKINDRVEFTILKKRIKPTK